MEHNTNCECYTCGSFKNQFIVDLKEKDKLEHVANCSCYTGMPWLKEIEDLRVGQHLKYRWMK